MGINLTEGRSLEGRGIAQFDALVALGQRCNDRLLEQEKVSQDCFVPLEQMRGLGQSTVDEAGPRVSALRFGDQRVLAVLAVLAGFGPIPGGLSNKHLRQPVSDLLGAAGRYTSVQMSNDLRRLRLKGLVVGVPRSHAYLLTELGAIASTPPVSSPLAQALVAVFDLIQAAIQEARFAPVGAR